jgi:poly(3-hydroxybutyrate) depolymerase
MKSATPVRANGRTSCSVPLIVFHGDRDATVHHANADALVEQAVVDWPADQALSTQSTTRLSEGGRVCDRVVYQTPDGRIAIDYWTIRGAGHLWAGGNPSGSHTDGTGPNASAHFWRFFKAHAGDVVANPTRFAATNAS